MFKNISESNNSIGYYNFNKIVPFEKCICLNYLILKTKNKSMNIATTLFISK